MADFVATILEPWFNILFIAIFLILAVGFYTEKLDWMMIYYGCAPESKKEKMPKDKIILIAWSGYFTLAGLFALCLFCNSLGYYAITSILHLIIVILFLAIHISTFILSRVK